MTADYKSTVFLPATPFPLKAGLPQREPEMLKHWAETQLYEKLRAQAGGREKFILHDGPPYANGHLHIGHALNKILKDMVNRSRQMQGYDSHYVPGWDCHGLPIEWKIEEAYREKKRDKDSVPVLEFRRECREFAAHWVKVQGEEFQRLGVLGDWDNAYTTMAFSAEAKIVEELGKFLLDGSLYRGAKPVLWSVVEKTALAEAEVEYHDHTSTQVYVRFPITNPSRPELKGASIVIWTTTPWTLPGNRAVAYGNQIEYLVMKVTEVFDGSPVRVGEKLVVAEGRATELEREWKCKTEWSKAFRGRELLGTICSHPLSSRVFVVLSSYPSWVSGIAIPVWHAMKRARRTLLRLIGRKALLFDYDFTVPLVFADFVSDTDGSGFVHIAPGHGEDDFRVGELFGLEVPETVGPDGEFFDSVPMFGGKRVLKPSGKTGDADAAVVAALEKTGALLAQSKLVHSYPHSWRSKAPLIFRTTPQWFISMEKTGLRNKALHAIQATQWVPPESKNRIFSMVHSRPDWTLSRQRAWGVPIAIFVNKRTGEVLRDAKVMARIAAAFESDGSDAWFTGDPRRFLAPDHEAADYDAVADILDVWFDSGCTHAFVLEGDPALQWPASLYLEGSDQHRGWFQSSLLESCGTRGRAPYEAVLTHGFVLDEQGRKMSKSLGNVTSPQEVVEKLGADILRLWVASSDYSDDLRIGPEILKSQSDVYRRLRNTLRYLLGSLAGFSESDRIAYAEMPELERYILHGLWSLDELMRRSLAEFDFHTFFSALHNFCAVELSSFYFDIRKDSLYCDAASSPRRRAARTVLDHVFSCLTAWLAPVLCFTAEEAWLTRFPDADSVHLRGYPGIPPEWRDDSLAAKWDEVRKVRRVVTGALELERANKKIGSSLQAHPTLYAPRETLKPIEGIDLAETCITSAASIVATDELPSSVFTLPEADVLGVGVIVAAALGHKCARCWRVLPEVKAEGEICNRCTEALAEISAVAGQGS